MLEEILTDKYAFDGNEEGLFNLITYKTRFVLDDTLPFVQKRIRQMGFGLSEWYLSSRCGLRKRTMSKR